MSDFVQRLVARGAGKAPATSLVLLQPRPLSRFETAASSSLAEGAEGGEIGLGRMPPPEGSSLSSRSSHRAADTSAGRPTPVERMEASTLQSRPGVRMPPIGDSQPVAETRQPHDATPVSHDRSFAEILAPRDRTAATVARPLDDDRLAGPPTTNVEIAERTPAETLTERPGAEFMSTEPASRPLATGDRPPSAAAAWPIEAPDEAPAPVTVTIGRIDVQYIQPQPRAAAAPPQVQCTRGFDAYARARRGEPR